MATKMASRERVFAALDFRAPDIVPLEFHPSHCGLYDHGEKLKELFSSIPGDFGDISGVPIPSPAPSDFDADGRYHVIRTDAWGITWEYRIFGLMGHPLRRPLDVISLARLAEYILPPPAHGDAAGVKAHANRMKSAGYFCKMGGYSLLERMIGLRRFEDVLMDIAQDTDEINTLADMLVSYYEQDTPALINAEIDCVAFGDDYGTQNALIMSPADFRRFVKPRLARMIKPFKDAGIKVHFHSCGYVYDILPDLKEIGVDSIWPQLAVYNLPTLADTCRDLGLAAALHIDRAAVMTSGTPELVRETMKRMDNAFKPRDGGSWFYVEIDNGFPYANIEALVDEIAKYRQ